MARYFVGIRPKKENRDADTAHITLDYLGDLDSNEVDKVKKTLKDIAHRNTDFNLELHNKGLATFGNRLVSELYPTSRLSTLQKDIYKNIDTGASQYNIPDNFKPHISLHKIPKTRPIEKINKIYLYSDSKPVAGFKLKDRNILQRAKDYFLGIKLLPIYNPDIA